jgi:hypothetical protein
LAGFALVATVSSSLHRHLIENFPVGIQPEMRVVFWLKSAVMFAVIKWFEQVTELGAVISVACN